MTQTENKICFTWSRGIRIAAVFASLVLFAIASTDTRAQSNDLDAALQSVLSVEIDGSGSAAAAEAFPVLAKADVRQLPKMLAALDGANPIAANWIYGAIDAVVGKAGSSGSALPMGDLEAFVQDAAHSPRSRQRAFMLLENANAERAAALVPGFIDDSSPLFRREAVAAVIAEAEALNEDGAEESQVLDKYRNALSAALDEDQVLAIAKALTDAGENVDLPTQFGYLMEWRVIGPFNNAGNSEFLTVYPPEQLTLDNYNGDAGIQSDVTYEGKLGEVSWKEYVSEADNGEIDLNVAMADEKAAVAYGATVFDSAEAREVQLRLRIQNAFMVWVNGQRVVSQPIGHTGNFFDQYTVPITLRKGPNLILVKSVQIEPPAADPWYSAWQFCVRVTDETGKAILSTNRGSTEPAAETADGETTNSPR